MEQYFPKGDNVSEIQDVDLSKSVSSHQDSSQCNFVNQDSSGHDIGDTRYEDCRNTTDIVLPTSTDSRHEDSDSVQRALSGTIEDTESKLHECSRNDNTGSVLSTQNSSLNDTKLSGNITDIKSKLCEYSANIVSEIPTQSSTLKDIKLSDICSMELGSDVYFKGCKWAPDGLCLLTCSNDNVLRLVNTPRQALERKWDQFPPESVLTSCLDIKEAEIIYDYAWWPHMNSMQPDTCCFVSTAKDQPIHLWDAFNGQLRASYIAKDHVDEVSAARSLNFSPDGLQLICGFAKYLRLFYIDKPGTSCETWPTRKHKKAAGQRGIISSCEFSPDGSTIACGSYDGTLGMYSAKNGELTGIFRSNNRGVTQVRFSPDGNRIYSGSRMDDSIICWDLRYTATDLFHFARHVDTNQRVYFDIAARSQTRRDAKIEDVLVSGSTDGSIRFWDLSECLKTDVKDVDSVNVDACLIHQAHRDCVNGVSVHPFLPVLATSSGQRHYESVSYREDSESDGSEAESEENRLKLWHIDNWTE